MADKVIDYDALGQVIDSVYGSASTRVVVGESVIFSFGPGGTLLAKFNSIVNFGNEGEMVRTKRRYADEAGRIIKVHLDRVKSDYKSLTGQSISLKEIGSEDTVEMLSANIYNLKKTALFKRVVTLEIT